MKTIKLLSVSQRGRDLHADLICGCGARLHFNGLSDPYFFDHASRQGASKVTCHCGLVHEYMWKIAPVVEVHTTVPDETVPPLPTTVIIQPSTEGFSPSLKPGKTKKD